ncbi:Protein kinase of the Mitotic Exit Network [Marasmius tenuissimus]|uniref:Protein kinase of the Mitotic Exit Network n=1 Tax=Marasmius tenuissimus TaxID=585030 RepID=A0ABR2ZWV0_9AGAR
MAAAVLKVSGPFNMPSHQRLAASPPHSSPAASSSRSKQPSHSSSHSSVAPESSTIKPNQTSSRPTLLQSLRSATRSKKSPAPAADDFENVTIRQSKGKEKAASEEKPNMLRRLESKVNFRNKGRESVTPSPSPLPPTSVGTDGNEGKVRVAGSTSYTTPSLRLASMSSPALHLSSQALPSPKSRSAIPASSSSTTEALVSPSRDRSRRASVQPPKPDSSVMRHRSTKSSPINIPTASASELDLRSPPETPRRRTREEQPPSPPETPTPLGRVQHGRRSSGAGISPPSSPIPISSRNVSPIRARSPSTSRRVVSPSHRGLVSSSTSHLPNHSPSSSPTFDPPRRPSFSREQTPSPVQVARPRPTSPNQRSYSQNRHFNISTTSLSATSNPEHRELIRTATSMLCKEIIKPPANMARTSAAIKEWEEVELRTRALVRLERIWGKSGVSTSSSNVNVNVLPVSSSGLSVAGEERERRLFTEALRDGFVLCQLMNKLRNSSVVRPDIREDGLARTSNITKFLAACASWGLSNEELFQGDDLIEANSESLARVAQTIIALIEFAHSPSADRSKVLYGHAHSKKSSGDATSNGSGSGSGISGPYKLGSVRSASASTPNLVPLATTSGRPAPQISITTAPVSGPVSPSRAKRWSPPSGLPTVRSSSPDEGSVVKQGEGNVKSKTGDEISGAFPDRDVKDASGSRPLSPPPRSPLRARSPKRAPPANAVPDDNGQGLFTRTRRSSQQASSHSHQSPNRSSAAASSTHASIGDDSIRDSVADNHNLRVSRASTTMTDATTSTTTTVMSSLLERGNSGMFSKFGTIRTMTTEATSEAPSITRTEGSSIAEDLARKQRGSDHTRDRKASDVGVVDLSRVIEETEESGSSSRGGSKGKSRVKNREEDKGKGKVGMKEGSEAERVEKGALRLGKGKWPDDFIDALHPPSVPINSSKNRVSPDPEERVRTSSIISSSPPRKLAIVGASRRNESLESLPQFPRRPSHRARHSVDAPVLLPKESIIRRDSDGLPSPSGSSKVLIRRHSARPSSRNGLNQSGSGNSGSGDDRKDSDGEAMVPFPRTVSADHSGSGTPRTPSAEEPSGLSLALEKSRPPRGRFQSDVQGTKRRPRPSSYDELGAKPGARSRFESMVNLGGAGSGNASASDLMARDSMDGSAVRKPLIIKEEGKVPTHFQLGNCIGRGQFGSVYRALNLNTGQMVAVKRIRLDGLNEEEVTQLMKEVDLVKRLSHPSIVKYEGMARDADTLSIVLEYAENGSLGQTLKAFGKLNERLVASYVVRILEGLHYLHQSDVVHCDLKAANILTTKNGNVKLSDFGVSLNMRAMEKTNDVAGTPNWMAPEVIELKGASPKSDIWSLACTVIELLTGRPPYGEIPNSMSVMFKIVEDDRPPIPPACSPLLEDFLKQCFNKDPAMRPSAELLCEHQWLKQNWGAHKELRPQDSIPFLRRVSADLQKSGAVRYLAQIEMPDSDHRADDLVSGSPPRRRISNTSMRPSMDSEISPREHSFVKTTFSKPMICRVCLLNVKKSAVLCAQCSLICHSKCAINAPPTCDLRAQLLLYAQYAEKGNPSSVYSNPIDLLNEPHPKSPMSDVPFVSHSTPRTSLDLPSPPAANSPTGATPPVHPPTAFKFFRRPSKASHPDSLQAPASSSSSLPDNSSRAKLVRKGDRQSVGSTSTHRSANTVSSAGRKSTVSKDLDMEVIDESEALSKFTSPVSVSDAGEAGPADTRRHKKNKSSGNCIVQ